VEYRYRNSRESLGQVYAKYWDLHGTSAARWDFRFEHWEEFAEDLSARADINLVSDENYFHDLERTLEMKSKPYVDSNAFYVERWNASALSLLGQYSIDLTGTNEKTPQKLPELRYTIFEESFAGPIRLNFDGSATNFYMEEGDGVRRMDFSPQLTAAFGGGGLSLTPRAGARATFYDRSADSAEPAERKFFFAGVDLNSRLSRVYGSGAEAGIGRIRHSIEPTISYTYIPHVNQGNIPQFDAVDAVAALNATRFAVINRLTAHYKESREQEAYTTFDLLVFRLSQSYDLGVAQDDSAASPVRSDVLAELYARTPKAFSFTGTSTYNTYTRVVSSYSAGGAYTRGPVSLNLTEQYLRQPATRFLIGGGGLRINRWDLGAQWWRDVQNDRTTQEEYRAHYASQCWGIGFSYVIKPGETSFMAMLDLKGIGGRVWGEQ
jgi:LPS-assembly protein